MNKKSSLIIGGIILVAVSFYGGMQYANSKNQTALVAQNTTGAMRGANGGGRGGRTGGGFINGQVIAKDATSITVELRPMGQNVGAAATPGTLVQQGSKIVFYTDKTSIIKTVDGTISDLIIGDQVNVTGTANPDGSVSAQSVQIRPATPKTTN